MIQISIENDFAKWRLAARELLQNAVAPEEVLWSDEAQNSLFGNDSATRAETQIHKVSPEFLSLSEAVACCDDAEKWSLLYRLLWRFVYENRHILEIESDDDVRKARLMEKAVARDVHKFHAFVRFRRVIIKSQEFFVAWHEPQHYTVRRATPFFARRFGAMRFSILTPKGCAHWDTENLTFTEAVSREFAPKNDAAEDFWLVYYQSIFNPFRLKIKAMKAEFPVRHWRTLPEAVLIPELIRKAKELKK